MSLVAQSFKKVICGISGGVDSAVSAALLSQKGFEVTGVFMKNWSDSDEIGTCITAENELKDARSVCQHLGIELQEVSFEKEYWNEVFSVMLQDYENGMTPNPDVMCNRFVKFGAFYRYAMKTLGADAIATGHYARTSFGSFLENYKSGENVHLKRAVDITKDQTLFLSHVEQEPLRRTMFPLGNLTKYQVRKIAKDFGMEAISKKQDSVGICFIGDRKFSSFISDYIPNNPGPFINIDSKAVIGWHSGVHQWTVGQRCRLGGLTYPYYVVDLNPKTQVITVACGSDHPALYNNEVFTFPAHWIAFTPPLSTEEPYSCMFKFQHTEWTLPCQIWESENKHLIVHLSIPTRAITPGQQAVFYHKDICLGSAVIKSARMFNSVSNANIANPITNFINKASQPELHMAEGLNT